MNQDLPNLSLTRQPWQHSRRWRWSTRLIAATTAISFSLLQLPAALAEQDPIPTWLKEDKGGWLSVEKAQRMQRADQELLAHLSTLEQAQQRFITTHPSGLEVQYANQEAVVARDSAGNLLWSPTLDDYQKIQNGTLLLVDGALQVVKNGQLSRQVDAMGNEAVFRADGRVDHETAADGTRTDYAYSETGFTRTTYNPNGDLVQEYNTEGRLIHETTPEGTVSTYSNGILSTVGVDGVTFTYASQTVADGTVTASLSEAQDSAGNKAEFAEGRIATLRFADGTLLTNVQLDPAGKVTAANTVQPDGSRQTITGGSVTSVLLTDDRTLNYDAGWLRTFSQNGPATSLTYTLNASGGLATVTAQTLDGVARTYNAGGQLVETRRPDGTVETFLDGASPRWQYSEPFNAPQPRDFYLSAGASVSTGALLLNGNGANLSVNALFNRTWNRAAGATSITLPFIVSANDSRTTLALEGTGAAGAVRKIGLFHTGTQLVVRTTKGSRVSTPVTAVANLVKGVKYWVRFVVTPTTTSLTVWKQGQAQPARPVYTWTLADWNPRLRLQVRTGTLRVKELTVTTPAASGREILAVFSRLAQPANPYATDLAHRAARDLQAGTLTYSGQPAPVNVNSPGGLWKTNSWPVTRDTLPPTGSLQAPSLTNQRQITLNLTAVDPAAADGTTGSGVRRMRFSFDRGTTWSDPGPLAAGKTVTLPEQNGDYTIQAQFQDVAGNWSDPVAHSITLDTVPPALLLTSAALTNRPEYTLAYAVDGVAHSEQVALKEGENTLTRAFSDPAGNETAATWTITLDTVAPALTLASPSETDAERYDAVAQADGQDQPAQTWRLGRGNHRLIVEATDPAGNTSRARLAVTRTGALPELQDPPGIVEGQRLTQTLANGSVVAYVEGQLVLITTTDGTRLLSPTLNAAGQITGGWLVAPDGTTTFLQGGVAVWSKTPLGAVYWYSPGGWVEAVRGVEGHVATFAYRLNGAGEVTAILVSTTQESILLDPEGRILQRVGADGLPITDETDPPTAVLALLEDAQGKVTGLSAKRDGVIRTYDAGGNLSAVTLADQTQLTFNGENLSGVRLPDGTRVTDGIYDADSKLVSGIVTLPDGRVARYAGGQPVEATLPDGSKVTYTAGEPSGLTLPDGNSYTLTLRQAQGDRPEQWVASLTVRAEPVEARSDSLTELIYSTDWILQEATRSDGATLVYSNGRLNTLTQTDGIVISYAYDSAGRLASTVAASPDPAEPVIRSEYAYDRIRRVYKGSDPAGSDPNGVLLYDYSYEFQPDGAEITVLREIPTMLLKRYRDGLLISQTDPDGAVTTYEYSNNTAGYTDPMDTAVAAVQTLPGGNQAHYERTTDPAQPWRRLALTRADGTELTGFGQTADLLGDNNTVPQATGKAGASAQFTAANSQYLSAPDSPDLSMGDMDFSIAGWVYADTIEAGDTVLSKGLGSQVEYRIFFHVSGGNRLRFAVHDAASGGDDISTDPSVNPINPGEWNFVVAWHDSVHDTINIQLNNGPVSSVGYTTGSHDSTQPLTVGSFGGTQWFLNGRVDEVGIWKKVLTPQERADLYNAGTGNTFRKDRYAFDTDSTGTLADRMVAYYNLDEPMGARADGTAEGLLNLIAQAQLPGDPAALRRMVEQGALQLIQPDATDRAINSAVGAVQTLLDGTRVHHERTDPAQPWKAVRFTRPDGTEISASSEQKDPLANTTGVGSAASIIGNAAQFSAANSQYLSAPDSSDLSMGDVDFSIAGWVYADTIEAGDTVLSKGLGSQVEYRITFHVSGGNRLRFAVHNAASGGDDISTEPSVNPINPGEWNFVVAWHDSVHDTINIQLNNGPVSSVGYTTGSHDSTQPLTVGSRSGTQYFLNGRVDEVGIWKKALSAQERADLYNAGSGNTFRNSPFAFDLDSGRTLADGLTAYYSFDEPSNAYADSAHTTALDELRAQAVLPSDRTALRRMMEQGALQLTQPEPEQGLLLGARINPGTPSPVLARATVSYQGKTRESFTYSYEGLSPAGTVPLLTRVTDEAGVTRTYDATQRLVAIEQPDGTRYEVSHSSDLSKEQQEALAAPRTRILRYTDVAGNEQTLELPDPDLAAFEERTGEEVTIQHLSRRRLTDGTELFYQFGQLDKILLPDGRALTGFTVDHNGIPLRATLTLPDGTTKALQNGALIEVTRPEDQVKLRYRDNQIAEIHVPVNSLRNVTVSSVGLDAQGRLDSGEALLPSGDRLTLSGGRFSGARLADGTEIRSVTVSSDQLTGATLSVSGSNATLNNARDVGVVLPSGQEYRYRYKLDSQGNPTNELETMTFRDDFEDGNSLGWNFPGPGGSDRASIAGGDLRLSGYGNNGPGFVLATTGLDWADYTVTTRFDYEAFTGPAKEAAILFRWQGPSSFYMARILDRSFQPDRGVGWVLELAGPLSGERIVARLDGFSPSGTHTLSVQVRGSTFDFYLDGQYKGSASDSRVSRGTVGVGTNHAITRFHDLEVTFPGEDLRDPATRDVDAKLRDLRSAVAGASGPISRIGLVPAGFDPAAVDPANVQVLEASSDPDVQAATEALRANASDPSLAVITEMNSEGRRVSETKIDGSTILYTPAGKPAALYDSTGRLLTRYTYDAQNRLTQLSMAAARDNFPLQIAVLENEIAQSQARMLRTLAEEKRVLNQTLEAHATVARETIASTYQAIQDQLRAFEQMEVKGKAAKRQKGEALDQIRAGLQQVQAAQTQLEGQYAGALANLHQEIADANRRIEEDTSRAFTELKTREEEFYRQILRQELAPVAEWVYRSGLGRTASTEELLALVDQVYERYRQDPSAAVDAAALEEELRKLPEYQIRLGQVTKIKTQVTDWLTAYLRAPPETSETDPQTPSRRSLLASLGLTPKEAAVLTDSDAHRVLDSLHAQSLHFGHSAFLTLQGFLAGQNIQADPLGLAVQAILVDILTGTLNPKTEGDLELSLFALQRVSWLYGGSATPVQVSFDDLRSTFTAGPAIAHVNGNHYILVTSIAEDGTLTYREPNQGPAGETLTMTQAAFELIWKGYVLSARAPPHAWQVLTDTEAQQITGSFFGLIYIALIIIFREQIAEFLQSVAIWINDYIPSLLAPVGKSLLINTFSGFANLLQGNFKEALLQLGSVALTVAFAIINPVAFAVSTIVSTILNASGLDPTIARIVSAFVSAFASGGIQGMLDPSAAGAAAGQSAAQSTAQSFLFDEAIKAGITSLAIEGTSLGLTKAGLDPALASLAGIGVGTITNAMISGVSVPSAYDPVTKLPIADSIIPWHTATGLAGLGYTLSTQLAPTLAGELAFYGIQKLGESIGLDSRISQLAGMPIRAGIGNIANPATRGQGIVNSMWEGLKGGTLQVGLSFATQGLDPLLGGFASSAITGAIDGLLSPADPNRPLDPKRKGIFAGIADSLTNTIGGFREIGLIKPGDPVATAQGLAKLNDFSTIVREQGLGAAVETYATSLLYRSSVESLISAGNSFSIRQAINAQLQDPNNLVELDGQSVIQISLGADANGNKKYLWVDPTTHNPVASLQGQDYIRYGTIKVAPENGPAAVTDGVIERKTVDPLTGTEILTRIKLEAAATAWVEIYGPDGEKKYRIDPDNLNRLRLNDDGSVKDGILRDLGTGQIFRFMNGAVQSASDRIRISDTPQLREALQPYGLTPEDIDALVVDISQEGERLTGDVRLELSNAASPTLTSAQLTEVTLTVNEIYQEQTRTFFGNGISNPEELGTAPEYARRYGEFLTARGLTARTIPLFEGGKFVGDIIRVGSEIVLPFSVDREKVKGVILDQLAQEPLQSGEKFRLILYSGAGQAGIEAAAELGRERGIQFSDIILVDSPVFFESALPNVERITMLVGDRDPFTKIGLEATLSLGRLLFLGDPSGFNDLLAAPFKVTGNDLSLGMALPLAPVLTPFGFRLKLANPAVNSKITVHRFEGWGHLDFIDVEDSAKIERVVDTIEQAFRR